MEGQWKKTWHDQDWRYECYFRKYYIFFLSFFQVRELRAFFWWVFHPLPLLLLNTLKKADCTSRDTTKVNASTFHGMFHLSKIIQILGYLFRYYDLLSLRTLKRKIQPNESLSSWYSLAPRGFWVEDNRLLTLESTILPRREETM